jgi:transposase
MLRFLLLEAAQVTVRSLPEWRRKYADLMMRRGRKTAKVAMARRLAIRLYWMMRQRWDYQQWSSSVRTQDSPDIAMVFSRTSSN